MRTLLIITWLLLSFPAWAHKPSDSYLSLSIQRDHIEGRWDIALRDLNDAVGLNSDGNGQLTWGEVRSKHNEITAHALSRLTLSAATQVCTSQVLEKLIDHHTDRTYSVLRFRSDCGGPIEQLAVDYRLLFDIDAQHKGLLRITQAGHTSTAIFSQESTAQEFSMAELSRWTESMHFVHEGIWHIWLGFDHVLIPTGSLASRSFDPSGGALASSWYVSIGVLECRQHHHGLYLGPLPDVEFGCTGYHPAPVPLGRIGDCRLNRVRRDR